MVRKDHIPEYQQQLTWDRLRASIGYLSFIKDKDSAAQVVREQDRMVDEMTDAMRRGGLRPVDVLSLDTEDDGAESGMSSAI